jgi:hypothetical protein
MPNASVQHRQYEYQERTRRGRYWLFSLDFLLNLAGLAFNEAPVVVDRSCVCNMCKIEDKWQISVATPCATVALAIDLHVTRPVGTANDQFWSALGCEVNRCLGR